MKLHIGFDIDGTCTMFHKYAVDKAKELFNLDIPDDVKTMNYFDFAQVSLGKMSNQEFWDTYRDKYYAACINGEYLDPGFEYAMKALHDSEHEFSFITHRAAHVPVSSFKENRTIVYTEQFLDNRAPGYSYVVFNRMDSKVPFVKNLHLDIYVEDEVKNIIQISEHIPVIVPRRPYNQNIYGGRKCRIYYVDDLSHIPETIEQIRKDGHLR